MVLNKKRKIIFIVLLSIFALVIVTPNILIQFYKNTIKDTLKSELDDNLNAVVVFKGLDFSVFSHFPNITLRFQELNMLGTGGFKNDTLLYAKHVDLELNLYKLVVKNETELKSITFIDPVIDIVVLKDGTANYSIAKSDSTATTDTTGSSMISLEKIVIKNGKITYQDYSSNMSFEMLGVDHVGKGAFYSDIFDFSTETDIKTLSYTQDNVRYIHDKKIEIDLIMEMNLNENSIKFKENTFGINQFVFGIDGKLTILPNGYDMNLMFASKETSFKDILSLIPGTYLKDFKKISTEGMVEFKGNVKGKYIMDNPLLPAFHVEVKVTDAKFKVDTLPIPITDIQFDLVVDNQKGDVDSTLIDLKTFHMNIDGNVIHGRYKMLGLNTWNVDADIMAEIDLHKLKDIYPIKSVDMEGKLSAELKAKGIYRAVITKTDTVIQQVPLFHLNVSVNKAHIKYDSVKAPFNNIRLLLTGDNTTGDPEQTTVHLKEFSMNMGAAPVSATIFLKGIESCMVKSEVKADIDLATIGDLYPLNGKIMKGKFAADIKVDGIYDQEKHLFPTVDAEVSLTNGYLKTPDYPFPLENIHFIASAVNKDGKPEDTRVNIDQFSYLLEGDPFSMTGYVEDFVTMNYDVKIKGVVHLGRITKIYPIKGVTVKGKIDSDIEARGSIADLEAGNYSKTYCNGTIELKHVHYASESLSSDITISDAFLRLTPSKVVMEKCIGKLGKSDVSLKGDLTNYMYFVTTNNDMIKGDLVLTSDTLNLTEWIDATTPSSSTGNIPQASAVSGSTVWQVPENIDFVFDSDIKNLLYEDININNMKGEITIKNGVLSLSETGFNSLDASFGINAHYDTRDILHPKFDCKLTINELDINKAYREIKLVRTLAPAAGDTYGRVTVDYQIAGELNKNATIKMETLIGGGRVSIADAKINGMKMFEEISKSAKKQEVKDPHLKDMVVNTTIANNKLVVEPFELKVNGLNTEIEGYNDISGGTVNYIVKIELIEKIKIPFHVTGTYDNPKVAMGKGKQE